MVVRCNDERRSQRRRWAFFNSLLDMRFGMLLGTGIGRQEIHTVLALARAALGQGHEVRLFIMGDGVLHLLADEVNPWTEELQKLIGTGVEVACCASNTIARGITKDRLIPGVLCGSQYDHAEFVHWSDRYLAFT